MTNDSVPWNSIPSRGDAFFADHRSDPFIECDKRDHLETGQSIRLNEWTDEITLKGFSSDWEEFIKKELIFRGIYYLYKHSVTFLETWVLSTSR